MDVPVDLKQEESNPKSLDQNQSEEPGNDHASKVEAERRLLRRIDLRLVFVCQARLSGGASWS